MLVTRRRRVVLALAASAQDRLGPWMRRRGRLLCLVLGNAYERGEGVPRDRDRSRELYDRSCALGWASGCSDASVNQAGDR